MIDRRVLPVRAALAAVLAFAAAFLPDARAQAGAGADAELPIVAKLEADRDQADGELLKQLAAFKTPSAAKALVAFYGKLASLWMKREVLRVLREFDGVVSAGNTALDHVATVAANATEPELRDAAFDTLEHCPQTGRAYLVKIVELPVQQQVRERALELHAAGAGPDNKGDAAWYRKLFEDEKLPHKLREHAFEALAKSLDAAELQKFFHDVRDGTIRRMALEAMQRQKTPGTAELALETVKQVNVLPTDRAHAASVLVAATSMPFGPGALRC